MVENYQGFFLLLCIIFFGLLFAALGCFDNKCDVSLVIFIKFAIYLTRLGESDGLACIGSIGSIVLVAGLLFSFDLSVASRVRRCW